MNVIAFTITGGRSVCSSRPCCVSQISGMYKIYTYTSNMFGINYFWNVFQKRLFVHNSVCSQFLESLFAIVAECSQFCLRAFLIEIQEEIHHFAGWEGGGLRGTTIVNKYFVNKLACFRTLTLTLLNSFRARIVTWNSHGKSWHVLPPFCPLRTQLALVIRAEEVLGCGRDQNVLNLHALAEDYSPVKVR